MPPQPEHERAGIAPPPIPRSDTAYTTPNLTIRTHPVHRLPRRSMDEQLVGILAILVIVGGGGFAATIFMNQPPTKSASSGVAQPVEKRTPDELLSASLQAVRIAAYDEADLCATKVLKLDATNECAQGMRLLIGYVRQYSRLADEAIKSIRPGSTVELGGKWGQGTCIARDADSFTFQVGNQTKKFSSNKLTGIPGFKYCATASYLDSVENPANELILGARLFVAQQDEKGAVNPSRSRTLAAERWHKAAASGDPASVEHARLLLLLQETLPSP